MTDEPVYAVIKEIFYTKKPDYNPMLDHLGKFAEEPGQYAVKYNGGPRTFPYFNADNVENMKQARENYKRIMQFENGEVTSYGIMATATIHIPIGGSTVLNQELTSGGLWGIDSDSGDEYFNEAASEQVEELKYVLRALRFPEAEITKAANLAAWTS